MREWCTASRLRQSGILLLLLVCLQASSALAEAGRQRGLLWEIGRAGQPASYLFGTIHSEDPAVLALPAPVQQAFDTAERVVLEVQLDMDAMLFSSQVMLLGDGRRLSEITGKTLFEQTSRVIQTRGIPEIVLDRMKPWAAAVTLSMPASETGEVLDMLLYQRALQAGKQVFGLESIREQLAVFDDMPEREQLILLRDAVDNFPEIDAMHRELLDAWKQRDLATLMAINTAAMQAGDQKLAGDFQDRLITRRNRLMAERLQPYLQEGNAFVAVGALHLPGENGLLNLLEQHGYTIRVIY
jgi:uncharacterized protein YbaP (TraB family)